MSPFPVQTPDTAPAESRPGLDAAQKAYGSIPNLFGVFASSPAVLDGYQKISAAFDATAFDATERQVVLLTVSAQNGCDYCVAAHSAISKMQSVPDDVVAALRDGRPLADARLEALRSFTSAVVEHRGWVPEGALRAFLDAGYTQRHVLDVVLGVTMKTLSNYVNHVAETPLDAAFQPFAWSRPAATANA